MHFYFYYLRNYDIIQIWNGWFVFYLSNKDCMATYLYLYVVV